MSAFPAPSDEGPPVVVGLVLDTSGSLRLEDLERTRALAAGLLESLPSGSEVAVFTFDDAARLVLPRTSRAEEVRAAIEHVTISGRFTALHDALYDASRYLRDAPSPRRAILLVTDGKDENSALQLEDALAVAQQTSIPVFTVGIGRVRERVLRRIAKLTAGEYLPGPEATGAVLAARLLAAPESAGTTPADGRSATAHASGAAEPHAASAGGPATPPIGARHRTAWPWLAVGVGLVLGVAAVGVLALRRRPAPPCATCGRPLAGPHAACAFCSTGASAPVDGLGEGRTRRGDEIPDTVLARMDLTEEYLEKTVTLREQPVLAVTSGPGSGMVFSLNRQSATSLGRAKLNDIVLEDVSVSSEHCRIRPEDGRYVLLDLKSTNGTFVNERRVAKHPLAEGDVIKVGETYLQFRMNQKRE
ncbi:MAG: FHA domain-containing protein [Acidobacteria bacterium]|nr:FHA domain-containing protein [Acidobacteriota bacterium]